MSLELKINVRHSDTGEKVRTVTDFTNFSYNPKYNSLASAFSFDFYFDPTNQEHAEIVCVSHMHEVEIWYNKRLECTGYILNQKFTNSGKPELVTISGYSKSGALNDSDIPINLYPLETDGLSLKQIIQKLIKPFYPPTPLNNGLVIKNIPKDLNKAFVVEEKDVEEDSDEDVGKTSSESSQNIGSYITTMAQQRNIVISHNEYGKLLITTPNTKGTPIFNFDFTTDTNGLLIDNSDNNDAKKIPGLKTTMEFNGQGLHTNIVVVQQADDEEGSNATQSEPLRNKLIPIKESVIYRPRVVTISSGNEFTADEVAKYEMGKEIRENVTLKIEMSKIDIDGYMIRPNNTITIIDPSVFLYKRSTWFIQSIDDLNITPKSETCTLNCVLPFGYDFDAAKLINVFIDPHLNLPRFNL